MFTENKTNRKRTINFILKKLHCRGVLRKKISHNCYYNKCNPRNILEFLSLAQSSLFEYDTNVYVCLYQKVHLCFDSHCSYSYSNEIGKLFCPVTGKSCSRFIGCIQIQNKQNRIPSKKFCDIPQDEKVIDHHKSTMKMKNISQKLDNFYNQQQQQQQQQVLNSNEKNSIIIKTQLIKKREREIKPKFLNKGFPSGLELLKYFIYKKPLKSSMKFNIYINSYNLYNFITNKLTVINYLLSNEEIKMFKLFTKYENIISKAEYILVRVLPGIYRIKQNWDLIDSLQKKSYTNALKYIHNCLSNKIIINRFRVLEFLDFDTQWGDKHTLINWVTIEKWIYFLNVILRSYMFCERCGQINQEKKSIGPVKHILGVLYTLKKGYVKEVGPIKFKLIPQDNYLKQYGVLLEESKLSTYVEDDARKWVNEGKTTFQNFLDKGFEVMTDIEIRNIIFP